jgi:LysM repeat protein
MTLVTRVFLCFFVLLGVLFMPIPALAAATHTVLPGECLYEISSYYDITVDDLIEANGILDYLIYPGQELSIPGYQADSPQNTIPAGNSTVTTASGGNPANAGGRPYTVQPGDTLYLIAQKHGTSYQKIVTDNSLVSTVIYPGMVLYLSDSHSKTNTALQAVPQVSRGGIFQRPAPDDVDLLARLITAEADGEPYEGKVGVAAVVLNRVTTPGFPKTIHDVIYQQGNGIYQFTPVQNGWINRPASSDSIKAAKEAIGGADPTNGAIYFFANYSKSLWLKSRPVSKTIGNTIFSY